MLPYSCKITIISKKSEIILCLTNRNQYEFCFWEGIFDLLFANQSWFSYLHFRRESEKEQNNQKPDSAQSSQHQTLLWTVAFTIVEDGNFVGAAVQTLQRPRAKSAQRIRWLLLRRGHEPSLILGLGLWKLLNSWVLSHSVVEGVEIGERFLGWEGGGLRREPLERLLDLECCI